MITHNARDREWLIIDSGTPAGGLDSESAVIFSMFASAIDLRVPQSTIFFNELLKFIMLSW